MTEIKQDFQTIEAASMAVSALSDQLKRQQEAHKQEVDSLLSRINELSAQVAWLNRPTCSRRLPLR